MLEIIKLLSIILKGFNVASDVVLHQEEQDGVKEKTGLALELNDPADRH